jgi:hypothetical protein
LSWVKGIMLLLTVGYTALGLGLIVAPATFDDIWPWPIPRLPAGAIGSWLLTAAAAAGWVLREGDWYRARFSVFTYIVFYVLQLVAAARFASVFASNDWRTFAYVAALVIMLVLLVVATLVQKRIMRKVADATAQPMATQPI